MQEQRGGVTRQRELTCGERHPVAGSPCPSCRGGGVTGPLVAEVEEPPNQEERTGSWEDPEACGASLPGKVAAKLPLPHFKISTLP